MKDVYLLNYSVSGIKSFDRLVTLSFYKKIISSNPDTQKYNMKGIYGMNGSGKSGIVNSVDILKNLLINPGYLNNHVVQKNLDAMINKKTGELYIEVDYMAKKGKDVILFQYNIRLLKDVLGKYYIASENLSSKKAASKSEVLDQIFVVENGEIVFLKKMQEQNELSDVIKKKTTNLLAASTMCSLFFEKILAPSLKNKISQTDNIWMDMCILYIFGMKLHVYLDESDDHREYVTRNALEYSDNDVYKTELDIWINSLVETDRDTLGVLSISKNIISKSNYVSFEKRIHRLYEFLHIFKSDLCGIEIEKKEDNNVWFCDLVMVYKDYKIHAEYESTGIKKLIKLYAYLNEMVQGGIVFIDEFDSNLHDVYLCALLEYLMEYGKGQLCFTTHNVGPMDILKQHKKSIEFLSEDHEIYSWTTNGNYSPSKLYRNGMIEGSPFNVEAIDFIGVFDSAGEE